MYVEIFSSVSIIIFEKNGKIMFHYEISFYLIDFFDDISHFFVHVDSSLFLTCLVFSKYSFTFTTIYMITNYD